ncbi:MAG: CHAT domain-containing protein [Symploca sp. SIO3E6]|nr:CHAT domain-containing protein [Caldora sp. SIO3E6]
MKEKRQAYLELIEALINCSSGEEESILQANSSLIDSGLVQVILQLSTKLAEQGDQQVADWLENIASYLASTIGESSAQNPPEAEAEKLFQQGIQDFQAGQFQDASHCWQQALTLYRQLGNRQGEAQCLGNLGNIFYQLQDYEQAIKYHKQDLSVAREIGDGEGEAYSLNNLGRTCESQWKYQQAIEYYEQSLLTAQKIGDRQVEATALNNLGNTYNFQGKYQEAIKSYKRFLVIAREIDNRRWETIALNNLGNAHDSLGHYQQAIKMYEESLAIARKISDREGEANSLNNLGSVYFSQGQYQQAINKHEESLAIKREIGDSRGETKCLGNLGLTYHCLGQYQQAIDYHEQSLTTAQEIGDRLGEATVFGNLGLTYRSLGQYQQSIKNYKRQLLITREIGDRLGEATVLGNLGLTHYFREKYQEAINKYQESLAIAQKIGYRAGEAACLGNLGNAYYSRGQCQQAIEYHQQSLMISQEIGDRRGEASTLGHLGMVYYAQKQYQQAIDYHKQQLNIARDIGYQLGEGASLNNLGLAFLESGRLAEAEENLRQGIKVWESIRTSLGSNDTNKVSIFDTQTAAYQLLQKVLVTQNKPLAALEIAERGRARAFVELLEEQLAKKKLPNPEQLTVLSISKIREIAQAQKTTLVEYSVIFAEELYIWVICPDGEIYFRSVELESLEKQPSSSSLLSELVLQARKSLGIAEKLQDIVTGSSIEARPNFNSISSPLKQLYQYLIAPISDLLPSNSTATVVFIPQKVLFLLPFSALQDSKGKFLIEQHTIITVPSIQVLALTSKPRSKVVKEKFLATLIVGNPKMPTIPLSQPPQTLASLPGAEVEAKAIASLLQTKALLGERATKSKVVEQLPKAKLIHLATHGLLGDIKQLGVPGAIALAPSENDGFLTSGEILELELCAELVVLSACSTGQGRITGDGIIGLSRSFIAAGVDSLIVSLWSVNDQSTAFLMVKFYQILQQGITATIALNQAQRWLLGVTKKELLVWVEANQQFLAPALRMNLRHRLHKLEDSVKPFQSPRHWAAFCGIGQ